MPGVDPEKVIAFCLKNAGATYQRIVNKVFSTQIARNMEIYVDDMLIKSREAADHEANLRRVSKTCGGAKSIPTVSSPTGSTSRWRFPATLSGSLWVNAQ
ncbi:hypothetical protein LIER_07215 [Lithospermum erythrorhizon]|uniref:Reverse transcriptase domain-containing protein n=1 Tax=Lithospermum erythrorhizon TaxID=34254 RepID=A0AAV3P8T5_LITER